MTDFSLADSRKNLISREKAPLYQWLVLSEVKSLSEISKRLCPLNTKQGLGEQPGSGRTSQVDSATFGIQTY